MTHEQLIEKAMEHAKSTGIPTELLENPSVKDVAMVSFSNLPSSGRATLYLDVTTGGLISAEFSGLDSIPKTTGKSFSKRAQRVLALASEESRWRGCQHVGSDHLLLAMLLTGDGNGAAVSSSWGLSVETLRARIMAFGSAPEAAPDGYGPSVRNVLRLSSQHADTLGQGKIEPEHFVLGLLDEVHGPAIRILRHFGVDVDRTKERCCVRYQANAHENQPFLGLAPGAPDENRWPRNYRVHEYKKSPDVAGWVSARLLRRLHAHERPKQRITTNENSTGWFGNRTGHIACIPPKTGFHALWRECAGSRVSGKHGWLIRVRTKRRSMLQATS
jgi:hypothetical protein